ncbi:hypothetical protein BU24DRAFT_495581 [Aaosphaeria arxii CBS 175.79]|uniref:Serine/threonine-protein kinase Tel1 n=1 Tax=Aaosphaeria arxii CBS 175.79 TaxID=1450172 RepID=A0A6A5XEV7_9PLEO|nr:uncharacterized protein BU24DRAFT_495581 [Aaosphaeria arxii CBS 175.79]KAF2011391.1 hypothetical protein BU24DRAFT_495581 [Aaosphaeria arxii CBS 175.79]
MGVTNIQDAKVLISSSKLNDRTAGLKDLIHILRHNQGKPTLEVLGNKAYHALCETLFQCMRDERSTFLKGKSKSAKTAALLPLSASALRQIVNSGVRTIKSSTVENIVETIIEVLPGKDDGLIKPLLEDLPKALRALLEYQPHVERLSQDCWGAAVDFCTDALVTFFVEPDVEQPHSWSTTVSSRSRTPLGATEPVTKSISRDRPGKSHFIAEEFSHTAEDFVHCILLLTKASNAPVLTKADPIFHTLIQFLQHRTGRGHSAALAAINCVLVRISLHFSELTKSIIQELLPLMKNLWSDISLRDEILITLMHTETHLASILSDKEASSASFDLEALIEVIYADYRRRQENATLQFLEDDHLCFRSIGKPRLDTHPLNTYAFSLEMGYHRSETLWATVSAIAHYSSMLDERKRVQAQGRDHDEESFAKRPRATNHFQDFLRHVSGSRSNTKRAALQVLAFMVQEGPLTEEDVRSTLERLTVYIADENPVHSSWAMIALAATAFQRSAKQSSLLPLWISVWQSASRVVTSVSSSRAACHLANVLLQLRIVPFSAVSETVQSMLLSIELSGPAVVSEASSSLMATIVREKVAENPTQYNQTADRVLNWILSKWTPSLWSERTYSSLNAHHCVAQDVLLVLHACLDRPFTSTPRAPFLVLGIVAQARIQASSLVHLRHYLLLLDDESDYQLSDKVPQPLITEIIEYQPSQVSKRILEFCQTELEKVKQRWEEWMKQHPQAVTSDMLRIIVSFCVVSSALSTLHNGDVRTAELESLTDEFTQKFVDYLSKRETEQYKVDAVLEAYVKHLPSIGAIESLSVTPFKSTGVLSLAKHLTRTLQDRREVKQSFYGEEDDMDIDQVPQSQAASGSFDPVHDVPRHDLQAKSDIAALRASCAMYCSFISSLKDVPPNGADTIPSAFVHQITLIHEAELLRGRQFLGALLSSSFKFSGSSYLQILERLGEDLIEPRAREHNTSEVANAMVVEVLIGASAEISPTATDHQGQDLYEHVEALYSYYTRGMEKSGVRRSVHLQILLATLLHRLLKDQPDIGQSLKGPSVRTSLFQLLAQGELVVKNHVAECLPSIFEDFVLPEHDKILEDVDSSLPSSADWLEGIAIRLLVLSKLASRWHTLLRQGVYRIFATAGSVSGAGQHAKRCIELVAHARNLSDPQDLFRLFAPQIIFTWLDRQRTFDEIPYRTFNYADLPALLRDIESEAVGQAMMLGLKEEISYLAQQLGSTTEQILKDNFGKAAAYTLSWDTCKGFARNKADASNAMLLRELLGADTYGVLIRDYFPQVMGHIVQTMHHEERITKALEKRPAYLSTNKALVEMNNYSQSTVDFDLGIEPSFSAFYLFDQIERLCRRTSANPVDSWTAGNYTFVLRMLLDRIHPALGSLHARSIIRKIRILVALAGNIAYEGYPLQMALQSLRPFLTDIQCADDTLGIIQYLFEHGSTYLRTHLSFVTGIGLSILISIRVFLGSSQDSTTQQSQHAATMNKTQRFHTWFVNYLESFSDALEKDGKGSSVKAFQQIMAAASRIRTEGNSIRGSEESKLLLQILDDVRYGRKLLNNTSREVALDLLCQNFKPAPNARDDVLGSDKDVAEYASQVWESCQRSKIGDGYLLWAARVLGRAFSAHGEVKRITDQSRPWSMPFRSSQTSLGAFSREAIIKKIVDLFYSDDRKEVSLAEECVRLLISRLSNDSYLTELENIIPRRIADALHPCIPSVSQKEEAVSASMLKEAASPVVVKTVSSWIKPLTVLLCRVTSQDPILGSLSLVLIGIDQMAEKLFPYILHLVLLAEFDGDKNVRQTLSEAFSSWFDNCCPENTPFVSIIIQSVLYLRSQPTPKEVTRGDRDRWLKIDFLKASQAATTCGMYRSALLFAETSSGQPIVSSASRRSSILIEPPKVPVELQLSIYKNLDEPDSFYGIDRGASLSSVLDRLEYEGDGIKSLLFRGARLDSQYRSNSIDSSDSRGMVKSLITLNMNSVTHSLLSNDQFRELGDDAVDSTLHTARNLGQWDIKAPEVNHSESSTLFKAFQGLHNAKDVPYARAHVDRQLLATMNFLSGRESSAVPVKTRLRTLAVLTEADEVLSTSRTEEVLDTWDQMKAREKWMRAGEFEDVRLVLSCRETLFSVLSANTSLQNSMRARPGALRHMEVEALVSSSTISRRHGALQESLASVTYLSDIVQPCKAVGLDVQATAQHEVANVLWDQGETDTSIRIRQHLIDTANFNSQDTDISLPVLLARLGHHIAEARLAKPDTIIKNYLEPAINELKGQVQGVGPGQVFHEFALFCDRQIQSPEAADDLARIKTVMDRKLQEHQDFMKLSTTDKSKGMRETYRRSAGRAYNWYKLDHAEYERLRKAREQFLRQCIENYLLSLQASDEYNNDALRVFSLWLEYADTQLANDAVKRYLSKVPSGKFALLMNQLSSRLQAEGTDFQRLLSDLVFRICAEHPYHGMHQIFAIQMKVGAITREDVVRSKDEAAKSRQRAANEIAERLGNDKRARGYWTAISHSNELYHALAMFKNEADNRQGREIALDKYPESKAIVRRIPVMMVPPATLQVEVRANCDYQDLPKIVGFKPRMSIANGLSAPKVISAIGSDGKSYKQLFKSGNDDLRQDAIMEQVFDQVSRLLKNHTATRLRNLGIRTYKVLPLSTRSGLMEFVQNTVPLHQWVMPAHEKYYPNDWRSDKCRKEIAACQSDSLSTRVKVWRKIADNFHPVLRYFLLERFQDPDEWFEKRLAYTRSTAAISILGHVLGLGDRHCHNILLDEKSGEIVHIDLGVSFEAGRVLPVPEVVPFRLTRDLVDAMGYTKTEGVFRRCCEFTMDTLREERESIMTLLNVLRYDPLVNWSVTPTKAKRMQEGQETNANTRAGTVGPAGTPAPTPVGSGIVGTSGVLEEQLQESNKKRDEQQAGEAGRALSVVEKKLSKTLSTKATVNELIQTATDDRNLAVLYCGWASYA